MDKPTACKSKNKANFTKIPTIIWWIFHFLMHWAYHRHCNYDHHSSSSSVVAFVIVVVIIIIIINWNELAIDIYLDPVKWALMKWKKFDRLSLTDMKSFSNCSLYSLYLMNYCTFLFLNFLEYTGHVDYLLTS